MQYGYRLKITLQYYDITRIPPTPTNEHVHTYLMVTVGKTSTKSTQRTLGCCGNDS